MAFLNPNRSITTCTAESCDGCPVSNTLHCHFSARDLAYFMLVVAPPFMVGMIAVAQISWTMMGIYGLFFLLYFGLIEIRVMCSHCPHYAESGPTLQCWANYGMPRLWKYRPGPMNRWEVFIFFAGFASLLIFPMVIMVTSSQWLLLFLILVTGVSSTTTLLRSFCSQCFNFACPLNRVPQSVRDQFFERNPTVAEAWEYEK